LGYTIDPLHPYRFHSPIKTNRYSYIDLLTFTLDKDLESRAQFAMSVGPEFSFDGMSFALSDAILIKDNIYAPNPLGMIYLKMNSYLNEPKRLKDFGDICEMVIGLVLKQASITELKKIVENNSGSKELAAIKKMFVGLIKDISPVWDYDIVEKELINRETLSNLSRDELVFYFEKFKTDLNF
jgi:hypothetical protein